MAAVIFEGTFAELQERLRTLSLAPQERVRVELETAPALDASSERKADTAAGPPAHYPTQDEIKDLAEDDADYALHFYRPSRH